MRVLAAFQALVLTMTALGLVALTDLTWFEALLAGVAVSFAVNLGVTRYGFARLRKTGRTT